MLTQGPYTAPYVGLDMGRRPLLANPGMYVLRLLLSSGEITGFEGDEENGVFAFDSASFTVDGPPCCGECSVFPDKGDVAVQTFALSSRFWKDRGRGGGLDAFLRSQRAFRCVRLRPGAACFGTDCGVMRDWGAGFRRSGVGVDVGGGG